MKYYLRCQTTEYLWYLTACYTGMLASTTGWVYLYKYNTKANMIAEIFQVMDAARRLR